jgi:hypothetical protein
MSFLGLDVIAIKALARQLEASSSEVDVLSRELTAALGNVDWFGPDQRKFVSEWNSTHRASLQRVRELLATASNIALQNAKDQERKSTSGGGGGGGGW